MLYREEKWVSTLSIDKWEEAEEEVRWIFLTADQNSVGELAWIIFEAMPKKYSFFDSAMVRNSCCLANKRTLKDSESNLLLLQTLSAVLAAVFIFRQSELNQGGRLFGLMVLTIPSSCTVEFRAE